MSNAFSETNSLFRDYLQYKSPYSYIEWMALAQEKKAAALFVQFYEQITLAWFKVKSFYTPDEDGVTCMMQYLMKNVPVIEADPKRYTPKYIYRVAFNCLYCICHDIKRDRERYENEISDIVYQDVSNTPISLFDTVSVYDDFDDIIMKREFWRVVNSLGPKAQKYLNHIVNEESLLKLKKNSRGYGVDPLSDVEVKLNEIDEIVAEIREKLSQFRDMM